MGDYYDYKVNTSMAFLAKKKISLLKDFGVNVTPALRKSLTYAKNEAELDKMAMKEIDVVLARL